MQRYWKGFVPRYDDELNSRSVTTTRSESLVEQFEENRGDCSAPIECSARS